jgi:hypothetical protein
MIAEPSARLMVEEPELNGIERRAQLGILRNQPTRTRPPPEVLALKEDRLTVYDAAVRKFIAFIESEKQHADWP